MKNDNKLFISDNEALVLFEYFERFDETEDLSFVHPAEYICLQKIACQVCKIPVAIFDKDYAKKLDLAREEVSSGFQGRVPGLKKTFV